MPFKKVRIESDGTVQGTAIYDAAGKKVEGVSMITWAADVKTGTVVASVMFYDVEIKSINTDAFKLPNG